MLLVQALKERKRQSRKAEGLRAKIKEHCSDVDIQEPLYGTVESQKAKINEWMQGHCDCMRNIADLTMAISRTNLDVDMTITVAGVDVSRPIAYWVIRRTERLAELQSKAWGSLTDRNIPHEQQHAVSSGGNPIVVKIRRYFDPEMRDKKIEDLEQEIANIDAGLEVVNATTEVLGLPDSWQS